MVTVNLGDTSARWTQNGQAAVASVRIGWQVLPWRIVEGRKVPQIRAWQAGQAFTDEGEVRAWWASNTGHCPGVVCGEQSGAWVLDVDPRNGGDRAIAGLIAQYGELPRDTFMVTTPGGGWHYYFAWTGDCTGLRKHAMSGVAGLDVIAEAGWVAAPGAWGDAGKYELVPGGTELRAAPMWLLSLALVGNPDHVEGERDHSGNDGTGGWDAWIEGEVNRVAATPLGLQRSALLTFTGMLRRRGYARTVADEAALRAMRGLTVDPAKGPWVDSDVIEMLNGAWVKYEPANMDWAEQVSEALLTPEVEYLNQRIADALAPPLPPPSEPVADAPQPPALPPPRVAPPEGDTPEVIGPDDENAQALCEFARDRLMFVNDRWLTWNGQVWQPDDALFVRHGIVVELGHQIVRQAALAGVDGYQALINRASRLGTVQGRDACLNYAKHLLARDVNDLDAVLDWINTPDGMVNLDTGEVRPALATDLVTRITSAGYDPMAQDPLWERILADVIPSPVDREFFQRWCGYCLTGRTSEKVILAIHGPAGSGKSTVSEPFAKALGQYSAVWQPDVIVDRASVNVDEAMFRVRGARLVTVSEMRRGTRLNEGVVKAATGGDTVAARGLYQSGIQYRPQFKLWVHTNFVPDSADDALMRRFAFLKMTRELTRGEQDPRVKTLLEEDAGSQRAILAWAVRGWQMVLRDGGVGRPERSDDEVAEHLLRSDPVRRFLEEVLVHEGDDRGVWTDVSAMYTAYEVWCSAERIQKPLGPTKFAHALDERGVHKERFLLTDGARVTGYRGWVIRGVEVRNDYGV